MFCGKLGYSELGKASRKKASVHLDFVQFCDLIRSVPVPCGGRNTVLVHMCPVGRGLKRTGGQTEGRIVKKDSQYEFFRPPHCLCCCKGNTS